MAALDLEEQEKIAELKAWWDKFGGAITVAVLVAALGFAAYNGWQWYVRTQSIEASTAYEAQQGAIATKDNARIKETTGVLLDKYASTAYAQMGALAAAKANLDGGDAKTAKAQLQWIIDHAQDDEFKLLARLRLAGLLLDENTPDAALKPLEGTIPAEFQASFADRRGDVYVALKKMPEAKQAYEESLKQLKAEGHAYANIVQIKLDALSSEFAAPAPVAATSVGPTVAGPTAAAEPEKK